MGNNIFSLPLALPWCALNKMKINKTYAHEYTHSHRETVTCMCVYVCVCAWCININKYASKRRDNNKSNKVAPKHKTLSVFVLAPFLVPPPSPATLYPSLSLSLAVSLYACLSAWANVVSAASAVASSSSPSWRFIVFRARCETPTSVHLFLWMKILPVATKITTTAMNNNNNNGNKNNNNSEAIIWPREMCKWKII